MILLTTPSARSRECAAAIEAETGDKTVIASTLQEAIGFLREQQYGAVILDQCALDADPDQAEVVGQHTGTAIVTIVNCAVCGTDRVVRELRAALRRREKETRVASLAAHQQLRAELREPLTAVLLQCELALNLPEGHPVSREKLQNIYDAARAIRDRIGEEEPALS
jgi:signal transduction histidine kinase